MAGKSQSGDINGCFTLFLYYYFRWEKTREVVGAASRRRPSNSFPPADCVRRLRPNSSQRDGSSWTRSCSHPGSANYSARRSSPVLFACSFCCGLRSPSAATLSVCAVPRIWPEMASLVAYAIPTCLPTTSNARLLSRSWLASFCGASKVAKGRITPKGVNRCSANKRNAESNKSKRAIFATTGASKTLPGGAEQWPKRQKKAT